ncbi:MAG TPA: hypothetical protein VFT22_10495 [Kofleriaceae bacterium]|nr:hypothetical protein [Kofleriaceae bacterium]
MPRHPGPPLVAALAVAALVGLAGWAAAGPGRRMQITVWAAAPAAAASAASGAFGGASYGGAAPTTGAMITEQREVEIAGGEARIAGVAATLDPASVQLRDLTDPGALISEQRFVPGATTPTELLARHLGDPITVVTPRGEVAGTLRSIDDQALVVEVGAGDQRHLQVMRRDGYVQDVRLPVTAGGDRPSLVWRVQTVKPGRHAVELSYRAEGMSWSADYLAVLDEAGRTVDLSAWATIRNATGASYDAAELTLVGSGAMPQAPTPARAAPPPARFVVPAQVRIGHGDAVQVELMPRRAAARTRPVITYEAMSDPSPGYQLAPGADCNQLGGGTGHAEVALELDVPAQTVLPDGKVRLFRRRAGKVELVAEDPLRASAGLARIRIAPHADILGDRHASACNYDEHAHTIQETIEIKLENRAAEAADVIVREYLWRWPVVRIEAEDHKGVRAAPQVQEYRVRVPGSGREVVTYTAVYTW